MTDDGQIRAQRAEVNSKNGVGDFPEAALEEPRVIGLKVRAAHQPREVRGHEVNVLGHGSRGRQQQRLSEFKRDVEPGAQSRGQFLCPLGWCAVISRSQRSDALIVRAFEQEDVAKGLRAHLHQDASFG